MNTYEKKIKLLLTIPTLNIGGAEVFCSNLAREFSHYEKYEVHILVFAGGVNEKFVFLLENPNITLHFLNKKKGFSFSAIFRLKKMLKNICPDIINSHSSHTLRYLLLINTNRMIPIVHTITNNPEFYNKYAFYLYKRRMHQKSWSKLSFVGISETISNTLSKIYNLPENRITTIYNGLYPLVQKGECVKKFDFFNCANLSVIKRHDLLLRSLACMNNKANLCIAGAGPEKNKLLKLCEELDIQSRVTFLGSVNDPSEFYFCSKSFILTSFSEGNPITINEAFSAGLPVIAPAVGGVPDLVKQDINGFLFPRDSKPSDIARIMDNVFEMPENRIMEFKIINQAKVKEMCMPNIAAKYDVLFMEKYTK